MKYLGILILSSLPLLAAAPSTRSNGPKGFDPEVAREMIHQWVQTERIISEEKATWKVEKQRMQELLDLYHKELKLLDEEIAKAGETAGEIDEKKEKLKKELKAYREAEELLADSMGRMLPRMKVLIKRLPKPLLNKLGEDIDILNAPDALATPRKVLRAMLSVLAESGRFNRSITTNEENRTLEDGRKVVVDVIYLGLARAFYVTNSGDIAGVGEPSREGWKWKSRPELAKDIRKVLAVYRKESTPQLVKLPLLLLNHSAKQ